MVSEPSPSPHLEGRVVHKVLGDDRLHATLPEARHGRRLVTRHADVRGKARLLAAILPLELLGDADGEVQHLERHPVAERDEPVPECLVVAAVDDDVGVGSMDGLESGHIRARLVG